MVAPTKKADTWTSEPIVNPTGVTTIRFVLLELFPFFLPPMPYADGDGRLLIFRSREDAIIYGKNESVFGFRVSGLSKESWELFKKGAEGTYVVVDKYGKPIENQS